MTRPLRGFKVGLRTPGPPCFQWHQYVCPIIICNFCSTACWRWILTHWPWLSANYHNKLLLIKNIKSNEIKADDQALSNSYIFTLWTFKIVPWKLRSNGMDYCYRNFPVDGKTSNRIVQTKYLLDRTCSAHLWSLKRRPFKYTFLVFLCLVIVGIVGGGVIFDLMLSIPIIF